MRTELSSSPRRLPLAASAALLWSAALLAACGDDGGPDPMPDGGPSDTDPPALVSTNPLQGERGVSPATDIVLQFDEPMDPSQGTVTVNPGGDVLTAAGGTWNDDVTRFTTRTPGTLPQGTSFEVVVAGFTDAAGNPIEQETLEFQTLDEQSPVVTASTPAQDATGLSARGLEEISLTFSEPMDTDDGQADLQGGPRSLGEPTWSDDARTVTFEVDGLAYERTYELFLFGFRDRFGNLFDDTVYLDAGVLRFSTGVDDEAPFVVTTTPDEGQMGVNPARAQAVIDFVEAMDTSVTRADLFVGDATEGTRLNGRWSSDARRIVFDLPRLAQSEEYRVDLNGRGYADVAGNAADLTILLGDGALDFSTGLDTFAPTVVGTSFAEEEINPATVDVLEITFNEAMDTSVVQLDATFPADGGTRTVTLDGSWGANDRVLTLDLAPIVAGFTYTIDLTGLTDAAGNPLDPNALEDGAFTIFTTDPTGETCGDALGVAQATVADGVTTWTLASGAATTVDGGAETCDSTPGRDIVLRYEKTTDALSAGGQLLRVTMDSSASSNIEVAEGTCDPEAETFASIRCVDNLSDTTLLLDVGPGTYFIYVSHNLSTSTFPAMEVSVEELDEFPEGEACANPYDTTSAIYTAPATADDAHVWLIPESDVFNYDRSADSANDPAACGSDTSDFGPDAVLVFDKVDAATVLEVTVENLAVSTLDDLTVEVSSTCDPTAATRAVVGCLSEVDGGADVLAVSAPAGPVYVWLARDDVDFFPQTRVSIREITVGPGESCGAARAIPSTGAAAVTLDSTRRFGAGTCFPATGNVTWYSYTAPASGFVSFTPSGSGGVVLVDRGSGREVCSNAAFPVVPAALAEGQELCIGLHADATITQLTVAEGTYAGLAGTVTDPDFRRAVSSTGSEVSWTSDAGMAVTPTTVYLSTTSDLFAIPKDGGERALEFDSDEGVPSTALGDALHAVGEDLWSLDDTTSTTSNRIYRLWDGFEFPLEPTVWDTPTPTYPGDDFIAMGWDGSELIYASNDITEAAFYRVPLSRPSAPARIGAVNTVAEDVVGLAADATYIYFIGQADLPGGSDVEGLFRIRRSALASATAAPEPLLVDANLPAMAEYSTFQGPTPYLDDPDDPSYLYFRSTSPNAVHVIADPDGTPVYLGTVVELGGGADYAMAYDYDDPGLYLFETETTSTGRIVRID